MQWRRFLPRDLYRSIPRPLMRVATSHACHPRGMGWRPSEGSYHFILSMVTRTQCKRNPIWKHNAVADFSPRKLGPERQLMAWVTWERFVDWKTNIVWPIDQAQFSEDWLYTISSACQDVRGGGVAETQLGRSIFFKCYITGRRYYYLCSW